MSKPIMSNEELFKKLSTDTGETAELVAQDFAKICEEVKADTRYVGITQPEVEQIARNKLITRKRREMNSPAVTWAGVVLAKFDLMPDLRLLLLIKHSRSHVFQSIFFLKGLNQ